jgi:type 1 fimbriae regulatory protein FimE
MPNTENGTSGRIGPPLRQRYADLRPREYLTPAEVELLMATARKRGNHRDATLILIAYRHGLRVGELCAMRWDQVDLKQGRLHVNRLKGSESGVHPLGGEELRALRRLQREQGESRHVFSTSHGAPLSHAGVRKMIARLGEVAGLGFPIHPHMLRHACGYAQVNKGTDIRVLQQYLGHRNIQHTVRYAALSDARFVGMWQD